MDEAKRAELNRRYMDAMHGVQTAVAYEISSKGENKAGADPKHLRTGINSAMVNDVGLVKLLIAKGLFTEAEYLEAIAVAAEDELARFTVKYAHMGIKFA